MNILLLGSGGREHALAWKIRQSSLCGELYVSPGNAGTASLATNTDLNLDDTDQVRSFIESHKIGLVVVGPEAPLVAGLVDRFAADEMLQTIPIIGPGKQGAYLEGSKDFSKDFMVRHGIPTASARTFSKSELKEGINYLETKSAPYVLKADGLAAGKGVVICDELEEAKAELTMMLEGKFGAASDKVVIEDHLTGIELSVFVLTDGQHYKILPEAKDYKRIGEGDTGPNTGGMGAISPVSFAHPDFLQKVEERVVKPTISGLQKDNIPYKGFIFIGLMNQGGDPYVIEYNVRMGDPETQAVMPRIKSDLVELLLATWEGNLGQKILEIDPDYATTVVMVSGGYPGNYEKGYQISGLEKEPGDAIIFHAGTKETDHNVVNSGGRVLAITGRGNDISTALKHAYQVVNQISWKDAYHRRDIGQDLIAWER